jgi:hypothetical protein
MFFLTNMSVWLFSYLKNVTISATVGGATEPRVILLLDPACVCALFSKISCWFYVNLGFFVMAFLRLHNILVQLEATAESRCVVEGEKVLCVVNFIVVKTR